ncbi:Breast cancer susceptibility1, putative isoform 1 [Hibiscus syriacus]|uniref:Breast cancer susceptibility1, putative isoform 1 n=1 Tax=Hibiscus syriacus TaxID=106335 RepID=A0A6A2XY37_HIBSY|nr:Breast cancer susceptibility1, putative isoform 1 [Hibiscus syriacus]
MLVQKRKQSDGVSSPDVGLRVVYWAMRYEISVNSQATFGGVKKRLIAETELQPSEQRVLFKGKDGQNGEYLDMCGVKNRSKLVLMEDPIRIERRFTQMKRNAKIQTAQRAINCVFMELDKLTDQINKQTQLIFHNNIIKSPRKMKKSYCFFLSHLKVSAIEKSVSNGAKVLEVQITTLIEMLMRQAIKLDDGVK